MITFESRVVLRCVMGIACGFPSHATPKNQNSETTHLYVGEILLGRHRDDDAFSIAEILRLVPAGCPVVEDKPRHRTQRSGSDILAPRVGISKVLEPS